MFVIIPDYISDEIDRKLDIAIGQHPTAEIDRAHLRSQLIAYLDRYGIIPDFTLQKARAKEE